MFDVTVTEFPFVQSMPKAKRSLIAEAWEKVRRLQAANLEEGGLLPVMVAARALNVTRSRIDQLVEAGKLRRFEIEGHVFISGRSVAEYAWDERKRTGRPPIEDPRRIALDIARSVASEKI